jgi:PAS domain S-box-containing protein
VFDALPVWVSVKDREGRFLMANRRAQLDTGLSAEQFQLMRTEDQPYLAAEEAARIRAADQRVLESGEPTEGEYPIALAPDRPRVHHTVKVPLRGAGGDIVGIVTVAEDITQRKMLEDELRQAQKMEAIGQLAGGVAHDFNNLLQIISGYTQFVLREASGNDAVARDLGQVLEATERGSQLTRQLLAFGRRQLLQRSEVDLNDSVQNLTRLLRRLFEENIELVSVPGANLLPVQADSGMIEQVLLNLCLNARDAMPQGGVLTLSTGNAALDREFCERNPGARPGRYAWVRVADTGRGVAPENVDRIFEPFFTTKEPGKGTGLGLAMAYGIVNQHGGLILVDNRPGEGAAFTVHLPAAAPAGLPDAAPEHSQPSGGRETILVAEDEARVRDMAERVLRHAGYSVLVAGDGEEAVREFEAHRDRIDLVLLDVIMPKRGGKVVYEHIRGLAPRLPVLFCSGYSGGSLGEYLEAGKPVRLLQKPFLADELLLKVRELLDRASPQSG